MGKNTIEVVLPAILQCDSSCIKALSKSMLERLHEELRIYITQRSMIEVEYMYTKEMPGPFLDKDVFGEKYFQIIFHDVLLEEVFSPEFEHFYMVISGPNQFEVIIKDRPYVPVYH